MDEQDQYESVGLDDSIEDERNLDEIMADRRAAEAELHARDVRTGATADRKLPRMLHDQGNGFTHSSYFLWCIRTNLTFFPLHLYSVCLNCCLSIWVMFIFHIVSCVECSFKFDRNVTCLGTLEAIQ